MGRRLYALAYSTCSSIGVLVDPSGQTALRSISADSSSDWRLVGDDLRGAMAHVARDMDRDDLVEASKASAPALDESDLVEAE